MNNAEPAVIPPASVDRRPENLTRALWAPVPVLVDDHVTNTSLVVFAAIEAFQSWETELSPNVPAWVIVFVAVLN